MHHAEPAQRGSVALDAFHIVIALFQILKTSVPEYFTAIKPLQRVLLRICTSMRNTLQCVLHRVSSLPS